MTKLYLWYFSCLLFICFFFYSITAVAQIPSNCPASPYPITITQSDGSVLTIIGKGNLLRSWTETLDGYTLIQKNGKYEYATLKEGKVVASGIAAKNAERRNATDKALLQQIPKSLQPYTGPVDKSVSEATIPNTSATGLNNFPAIGSIKVLLLLIKFPDLPNTHTPAQFTNLMNQPSYRNTGSFKDFYTTSSLGKLNVSTDVFGWYTASQKYAYYGRQNGWTVSTTLVREAVNAAQAAGVDFSRYDNDKNGIVDGIIVAHAGPGAEEGSQLQYVWSHQWNLSAGYNQVQYDGVWIDDYMITPERRVYTNDMVGRGIFCHEFGHNLGLPDLYDTDGSSEGIGEWSLMASAGWLGNEHTPGNMCAWSRSKLGWLNPIILSANGFFSLQAASTGNQVFRINTPVPNEYFLLENRQKTGLDVSLKGSGLAIWHINTDKTSMYPGSNYVNADENLKGVDLEEADGLNNLDYQHNRGDAGDLFPGASNKTIFSSSTNPNSFTYTNTGKGITIRNISIDGAGKAWFTFENYTPGIAGISPSTGPSGTLVTLTGAGFSGTTAVSFNRINASFSVLNDFTIQTTVPVGATTGLIRLSKPSGTVVSLTNFVLDYCIPSLTQVKTDELACKENYINSFTFNTLTNSASGCNGETAGYIKYSPLANLTTSVAKGQRYTISMQAGSTFAGYKQAFGVWIDYNNDLDFEDSGEFVYNSPSASLELFTGQITIPSTCTPGLKRLRIRCRYGTLLTARESCTDLEYGETEDYTISVTEPVAGLTVWDKRFGGSASENLTAMIATPDGGYLLGGYTLSGISGDKTQNSQGNTDYWIVKTDAAGKKLWDKRYGGTGTDNLVTILATKDGGYLLGGYSSSGISGENL